MYDTNPQRINLAAEGDDDDWAMVSIIRCFRVCKISPEVNELVSSERTMVLSGAAWLLL